MSAALRRVGYHDLIELIRTEFGTELYRARHPASGEEVLLRLFPAAGPASEPERGLMAAAREARRADAPGLLRVLELGREGREGYIVYERWDLRRRLKDELRRGGRRGLESVERARRIVRQAALAVGAAHRLAPPLVHGRLRPSALLLGGEVGEQVKVAELDLGVAWGRGDEPLAQRWAASEEYGAPEQRLGQAPTTAADVYALGAILYVALIGEPPPRDGRDPGALLLERRREVPNELARVVRRALSQAPADRYADGLALAEALSGEERPSSSTPPPPPPPPELNSTQPGATGRLDLARKDALRIAPGVEARLELRVTNTSPRTQHFRLRPTGLPDGWDAARLFPNLDERLALLPDASAAHALRILVPADPRYRAGARALGLELWATEPADARAAEPVSWALDLQADRRWSARLRAVRSRHSHTGRYVIELENQGNAEEELRLSLRDTEARELAARFDAEGAIRLEPGARLEVPARVEAARANWIGRPIPCRFQVQVHAREGEPRLLDGRLELIRMVHPALLAALVVSMLVGLVGWQRDLILDWDGDGVYWWDDRCRDDWKTASALTPDQQQRFGVYLQTGCQPVDSDQDEFWDVDGKGKPVMPDRLKKELPKDLREPFEQCNESEPGGGAPGGCGPDPDSDGVPDDRDECPNRPGPPDSNGCPEGPEGLPPAAGAPLAAGSVAGEATVECKAADEKPGQGHDNDHDGWCDEPGGDVCLNSPEVRPEVLATYRFGCGDKDGDGRHDAEDPCPDVPCKGGEQCKCPFRVAMTSGNLRPEATSPDTLAYEEVKGKPVPVWTPRPDHEDSLTIPLLWEGRLSHGVVLHYVCRGAGSFKVEGLWEGLQQKTIKCMKAEECTRILSIWPESEDLQADAHLDFSVDKGRWDLSKFLPWARPADDLHPSLGIVQIIDASRTSGTGLCE